MILSSKLRIKKFSSLIQKNTLFQPLNLDQLVSIPVRGIPPLWTQRGFNHCHKFYSRDIAIVNELTAGTVDESLSLEKLVLKYLHVAEDDKKKVLIFNHASQAFNYEFMFTSVQSGGIPASDWMLHQLKVHFGSVQQFERVFVMNANAIYGSGWTWLVDNGGTLEICNGFNGGNPIGRNAITPLLACSVWEHAYLHDWMLNRVMYISNYLHTVNWEKVENTLKILPAYKHDVDAVYLPLKEEKEKLKKNQPGQIEEQKKDIDLRLSEVLRAARRPNQGYNFTHLINNNNNKS